jgi:hypothetical protein
MSNSDIDKVIKWKQGKCFAYLFNNYNQNELYKTSNRFL